MKRCQMNRQSVFGANGWTQGSLVAISLYERQETPPLWRARRGPRMLRHEGVMNRTTQRSASSSVCVAKR